MRQRHQHRAECSYCGKPGHSYDQGHTRHEEHRKTKCDCCGRAGHRYELCRARQAEYHIKGRGSATATNSVAPGRLSTATTELNVSTTRGLVTAKNSVAPEQQTLDKNVFSGLESTSKLIKQQPSSGQSRILLQELTQVTNRYNKYEGIKSRDPFLPLKNLLQPQYTT